MNTFKINKHKSSNSFANILDSHAENKIVENNSTHHLVVLIMVTLV